MTSVLITGAAGQLGRELMRTRWPENAQITGTDRRTLDITDLDAVHNAVTAAEPDVIINAAAYTAVDRAEAEPGLAEAVNHLAVSHLAAAANLVGARLIHISTDYVFDGSKDDWYVETDPIQPLGVYGATKARGEAAARGASRHLILRTAWVYGALGDNFVRTMLRLGAERTELSVVDDQVGCPSCTVDLAVGIAALATEPRAGELSGTFHLASPTATTWHEFACSILRHEIDQGTLTIQPIPTSQYPTPAQRPANSRLDSSALAAARGIRLRPWQDALPGVVAEIRSSGD